MRQRALPSTWLAEKPPKAFRLADARQGPVGAADRGDLSLGDDLVQSAENVGDRHLRIIAMQEPEINAVGLELSEAQLDVVSQRGFVESWRLRFDERRVRTLGDDAEMVAIAARGHPFADDGFGPLQLARHPVRIDRGRVDHGAAQLHIGIEQGKGVGPTALPEPEIGSAENEAVSRHWSIR